MDMSALIEAISTVGFPVVMCAAMFWRLEKTEEEHNTQVSRIVEAISDNTKEIAVLLDRIGGEKQ